MQLVLYYKKKSVWWYSIQYSYNIRCFCVFRDYCP